MGAFSRKTLAPCRLVLDDYGRNWWFYERKFQKKGTSSWKKRHDGQFEKKGTAFLAVNLSFFGRAPRPVIGASTAWPSMAVD